MTTSLQQDIALRLTINATYFYLLCLKIFTSQEAITWHSRNLFCLLESMIWTVQDCSEFYFRSQYGVWIWICMTGFWSFKIQAVSGPRFVYKEPSPTPGTSACVDATEVRGWKFVFPINQKRAHFKLQSVYLRAFVQFSCLLKLCVME